MDLTPEVQAVIDAALAHHHDWGGFGLAAVAAINAYEKSIKPPEPFTRYMREADDGFAPYAEPRPQWFDVPGSIVWEVLITPVRKVSG